MPPDWGSSSGTYLLSRTNSLKAAASDPQTARSALGRLRTHVSMSHPNCLALAINWSSRSFTAAAINCLARGSNATASSGMGALCSVGVGGLVTFGGAASEWRKRWRISPKLNGLLPSWCHWMRKGKRWLAAADLRTPKWLMVANAPCPRGGVPRLQGFPSTNNHWPVEFFPTPSQDHSTSPVCPASQLRSSVSLGTTRWPPWLSAKPAASIQVMGGVTSR